MAITIHFDKGFYLRNVREFSINEMIGELMEKQTIGPCFVEHSRLPEFLTISNETNILTWKQVWCRAESDERGMYLATAWILDEIRQK